MILRRLAVRDFRRFPSFEACFVPGLNVILGNNEEGKSTLREAISLALFVDPKTNSKEILGLKRWGAAEQFAIELDFEEGGESYLLTKDFQARTARLVAGGTGETLQDVKTIAARMIELLGLPSPATFNNTVRISQREMTRIENSKEIADRLQEQVTGGEQDVQASRVLTDLDKVLNALKSASRSNPGPLFALPQRIASREAELTSRTQALARAERSRGLLQEREAELRAMRSDLDEKQTVVKSCVERLGLEEKLKKAVAEEQVLEDKLEQIASEEDLITRSEGQLLHYSAVLAVSQQQVSEIDWLERQSNEPITSDAVEPATPPGKAAGPRKSVAAIGLMLTLLGIAGGFLYPPLFALLVVGALVVGWELARGQRASTDTTALAAQQAREKRRAEREDARRRLDVMLKEIGCARVAEFRDKRDAAEGLIRSVETSRAKLEAYLSAQTRTEVEQSRKAASKVVRDLKEKLDEPAMRLAQMDQTAYQRLQREVSEKELGVKRLQEEILNLRVDERASQIDVDEVHALGEELQELKEQLFSTQERQRVLTLARQVLDESRTATLVTARDVLQTEIGGLISEITRGRYSSAVLDANLSIQLTAPEREEPVSVALEKEPSPLSTGTVEQVYLAARLALAKLLSRGRRPPLILDDPFVTFDPARTEAVLTLCKRLSAESQILLFTCHEEYVSAADSMVRLPAVGDLSVESGSCQRMGLPAIARQSG
ncbi:MAG: hypothetical protein EPO21_22495 [Chloroflexota bacterium]|nr:MAG: hypothetical protein EPO21_22495 [Chloroflexota bacterium]